MTFACVPLDPPLTTSLFLFNATATTEIYTLSLHDALPISTDLLVPHPDQQLEHRVLAGRAHRVDQRLVAVPEIGGDRKSTRLNSSHITTSYAVFCLKKQTTP